MPRFPPLFSVLALTRPSLPDTNRSQSASSRTSFAWSPSRARTSSCKSTGAPYTRRTRRVSTATRSTKLRFRRPSSRSIARLTSRGLYEVDGEFGAGRGECPQWFSAMDHDPHYGLRRAPCRMARNALGRPWCSTECAGLYGVRVASRCAVPYGARCPHGLRCSLTSTATVASATSVFMTMMAILCSMII